MSSARLPEHGDSPLLGVPPAPAPGAALDSTPAGLFLNSAPVVYPPHLVPCAECGALNGRSALACWSCEADLFSLALFANPAEPAVEPVAAGGSTAPVDGRHGLHLVSRADAPASVQAAPAAPVPAEMLDLPVLTVLVEDNAMAPRGRSTWHRERPKIALAIFAIALLTAAACLRWFSPTPEPVASPPPEPTVPRAEAAVLERPFAPPAPAAPDRVGLSFAPVEVAPVAAAAERPARAAARNRAAPTARVVNAAARPTAKPRETRETISPPPAACTSNMAALGFCTLAPASAKE